MHLIFSSDYSCNVCAWSQAIHCNDSFISDFLGQDDLPKTIVQGDCSHFYAGHCELVSGGIREDGTCYFSYSLKPKNSSATIVGTANGECFLNSSNSKFKMEGDGSIFKKWTDFSESGNYIIINDWKYEKK